MLPIQNNGEIVSACVPFTDDNGDSTRYLALTRMNASGTPDLESGLSGTAGWTSHVAHPPDGAVARLRSDAFRRASALDGASRAP